MPCRCARFSSLIASLPVIVFGIPAQCFGRFASEAWFHDILRIVGIAPDVVFTNVSPGAVAIDHDHIVRIFFTDVMPVTVLRVLTIMRAPDKTDGGRTQQCNGSLHKCPFPFGSYNSGRAPNAAT